MRRRTRLVQVTPKLQHKPRRRFLQMAPILHTQSFIPDQDRAIEVYQHLISAGEIARAAHDAETNDDAYPQIGLIYDEPDRTLTPFDRACRDAGKRVISGPDLTDNNATPGTMGPSALDPGEDWVFTISLNDP